MRKAKGLFILFKNCCHAFFSNINSISSKEDCYWTINETFFIGKDSKQMRDSFQFHYNQLVENFKNKI